MDIILGSINKKREYIVNDNNYVQMLNYFSQNPEGVEGSTVRIRGFSVKDTQYITDGYFALGKYIISCCVADAGVFGILVENMDTVNDNSWYEIEGTLKVIEDKYKQKTIAIVPTNINSISSENMYIYENYNFMQFKR